jgi:hypothetical protein
MASPPNPLSSAEARGNVERASPLGPLSRWGALSPNGRFAQGSPYAEARGNTGRERAAPLSPQGEGQGVRPPRPWSLTPWPPRPLGSPEPQRALRSALALCGGEGEYAGLDSKGTPCGASWSCCVSCLRARHSGAWAPGHAGAATAAAIRWAGGAEPCGGRRCAAGRVGRATDRRPALQNRSIPDRHRRWPRCWPHPERRHPPPHPQSLPFSLPFSPSPPWRRGGRGVRSRLHVEPFDEVMEARVERHALDLQRRGQ